MSAMLPFTCFGLEKPIFALTNLLYHKSENSEKNFQQNSKTRRHPSLLVCGLPLVSALCRLGFLCACTFVCEDHNFLPSIQEQWQKKSKKIVI
ncbi:hypothetical protein ElyMa_002227700 [Elysia marginata]|uniref:Uncharacterized protein n=1 Tax=Elysia marginata TaxID=1093978 RepID=A0AAV4FV55_9GAST|nr:hypothetical protein ElyMa_002227700 [Elysia marginata]